MFVAGLDLPGGPACRDRSGRRAAGVRPPALRPGHGGRGRPRSDRGGREGPGLVPARPLRARAPIEPAGRYDRCFLARSATVTGGIQCHEIAWGTDAGGQPDLWVVNTLFSCLVGLDPAYSFVPRWRPPFVTELAGRGPLPPQRPGHARRRTCVRDRDGPDRHARRLAGEQGSPAAACSTSRAGRPSRTGIAMPHSPRLHDGRLYVLNSGMGHLQRGRPRDRAARDIVAALPGYARGLAIHDGFAFVGLSKIRETAIFGGVPIAEYHDQLKCGVGVIDLATRQHRRPPSSSPRASRRSSTCRSSPDTRRLALGSSPGDGDEIWVVPDHGNLERPTV